MWDRHPQGLHSVPHHVRIGAEGRPKINEVGVGRGRARDGAGGGVEGRGGGTPTPRAAIYSDDSLGIYATLS